MSLLSTKTKTMAHVKTECNYGESVEGEARCPAYGF